MQMRVSSFVPFVVAVVVASCAQPAPVVEPPPAPATQAAVEQTVHESAAALVSGDAARAGATYATDAVFVDARGAVETRGAIEAFWTEALAGGAGKDLKLNVVKWGSSGDLAYSLSRVEGGTASQGYSLVVSERQSDGTLKAVVHMSIPDPQTPR